MKTIPLIDLDPWFCGDETGKAATASLVNKVCHEIGFMYVQNHGVSEDLIQCGFHAAQEFFDLPETEKRKLHFKQTGGNRGYLPIQSESSDPQATPDLKEAFDCGYVIESNGSISPFAKRMTAPNLWPDNLPGFRPAVEQYFSSMRTLAESMFEIFAMGFGLEKDFFKDKINEPIATLRLLHYPPREVLSTADFGIGAHCDYECFTILATDEVGGLQVQTLTGDWINVDPIPGTFVINIGEMLSRWTNDYFVATPHRVINQSGRERYSIPFFFATNYETTIQCLDCCVTPGEDPKYPPISAGEYLTSRLHEIYGV